MTWRWDDPNRPKSEWEKLAEEDPQQHWKRRIEDARRSQEQGHEPASKRIFLGKNTSTGEDVHLPLDMLKTHMHVLGATGVGKSFFLEGVIKSLILEGEGVCLIDPHGDLYHRVLDFCAYLNIERPDLGLTDRVIPVDIAERQHILGFNPIQRNARVKVYQVVALMEAIRKCWGQGSFQETPRLARWLYNTIYAVIDSGTTFLQTLHMVTPQANPYRREITKRITSPNIRAEWESLARKSEEKREDRVESCLNRIRPFVEHEVIRRIIGQHEDTINFHDVLGSGKIVLVNLARQGVISDDDRHLLGTLLVNELLTAAFARKAGERKPYYLFIDEFEHFVTKDICEILDGGRKFGLHLTLAHQHLGQLKEKDPEVYFSAMANARTKVVFGGMMDDDLDVMAKEMFVGELNPDEIKKEIWQTKFRPVETTRVIVSESESSGGSSSHSEVSHISLGQSASYIQGSAPWMATEPDAVMLTDSASSGSGESTGESWSAGRSSAEVPFYEMHEFRELSSVSFRSLEEQLYTKKAQMKRQETQHAAILIPGQNVELVKAPTLQELPISAVTREEFKEACFENAGCFKSPEEADLEVRVLEESLLLGRAVGEPIEGEIVSAKKEDDEEFWE